MAKKSPKKLTKQENAILARVRVPPFRVQVNAANTIGGAHFDALMQMPFTDKHDAAMKLRNLATLLACSSGIPEGGGTIYVGLRKKGDE